MTLVTNGGAVAVPPAAATSTAPVKKLLEGGVRHLTRAQGWSPGPSPGHPRNGVLIAKAQLAKAHLAEAKGRAKRRAEASSRAKAETKAES